jgi:hypothetical protein
VFDGSTCRSCRNCGACAHGAIACCRRALWTLGVSAVRPACESGQASASRTSSRSGSPMNWRTPETGYARRENARRSNGNSYDRRARRRFLISKFASASGKTIPCFHCGKRMRTACGSHGLGAFDVDRFPVCGHAGGTYRRDNIVPACATCNRGRCAAKCKAKFAARRSGDRPFVKYPVDAARVEKAKAA